MLLSWFYLALKLHADVTPVAFLDYLKFSNAVSNIFKENKKDQTEFWNWCRYRVSKVEKKQVS